MLSARARRVLPTGFMRPWSEVASMGLGLVRSPSSAQLTGRFLRSRLLAASMSATLRCRLI
jgi:hypothetical protein